MVVLYSSSEMDGGKYFPEVPSCKIRVRFFSTSVFFIILVKMKLGSKDGFYDIC